MSAVCWKCIEDEYLQQIVKSSGTREKCDLCGSVRKAFTAEDLAETVDPILREHFTVGESVKKFGEDDEEWWEQEGDPLDHHLQEVIGQYLGFEDEIVSALEEADPADERDGEIPFYDSSQEYVPIKIRAHTYYAEWIYVSDDLKYQRRFFSSAASDLFSRVFGDVESRKLRNPDDGKTENVPVELPPGTELFRARICRSESFIKDAYKDPMKHVGPPPPELARAGRMNVEGVVVFYGALDEQTCLAETRPAIGNEIAVAKMRTTEPLRLLDFGRLEQSYKLLSYFQSDFTQEVERGAFLRRLQNLISQPVVPGKEMDYLITQTMAEYLGHVHDPQFDGVLYKSVQRSGGKNIVLFQRKGGGFPLQYVDKSFQVFSNTSVEYKHRQLYIGQFDDGEVWVSNDFDDDED